MLYRPPSDSALSDCVVVDTRLGSDDCWEDDQRQGGAGGGARSSSSGDGSMETAESLLLALPCAVFTHALVPHLGPADKRALRATCQRARHALNQLVRRVVVPASSLTAPYGHTPARLCERFPAATELSAHDDGEAPPVIDDALMRVMEESPGLLERLQQVNVKQCHYVGRRLLSFLAERCPSLVSFSPSRWTDNGSMWDVARCTGLKELHLGDADVDILTLDDMGMSALAGLTGLQMLSLHRCRWVGDNGCMALAQLSSLRQLDLSHTEAGARGLAWVAALPLLHTLNLSDCRNVDDAALAGLAPLATLTALALRHTRVTNAGLVHLASTRRLGELDLGARFEVNDEGVAYLAACASLRRLSAGSFNLQRRPGAGGFSGLAYLSFGGSFANKGLHLLFPLPALVELHLQGIDSVTDPVMKVVGSQTSLEQLVLRSGYQLTDAGLGALSSLHSLSLLSLSACPAISRPCLAAFVAAHPRLRQLLVGVCCPVRSDSQDALVAAAGSS